MPEPDHHRYLCPVTLPEDVDRAELVRGLAEAIGADAPTIRLRMAQPPPLILGRFPVDGARRGLRYLVDLGGDAFLCARSDVEALGPTRKIRDLGLCPEGLRMGHWRGGEAVVDPADIEVIVRGHCSANRERRPSGTTEVPTGAAIADGLFIASLGPMGPMGFGLGGGYGYAVAIRDPSLLADWLADQRATESSSTHRIDLHLRDGTVHQIDGGKFGWKILGAERGHGDFTNIERMTDLLVRLNPGVVVDPYFRAFRPPADIRRFRIPRMNVNGDEPTFAFYSRWAALLYRHVMGGRLPEFD